MGCGTWRLRGWKGADQPSTRCGYELLESALFIDQYRRHSAHHRDFDVDGCDRLGGPACHELIPFARRGFTRLAVCSVIDPAILQSLAACTADEGALTHLRRIDQNNHNLVRRFRNRDAHDVPPRAVCTKDRLDYLGQSEHLDRRHPLGSVGGDAYDHHTKTLEGFGCPVRHAVGRAEYELRYFLPTNLGGQVTRALEFEIMPLREIAVLSGRCHQQGGSKFSSRRAREIEN